MVKIPAEKIAEVRDRVDIERVIGRAVKLTRKGTNLMGCCPFHQEKTPSFSVDSNKKLFHCFGCGVGGDVFAFVMKLESIEFPEAVRQLAQEVGVELPQKQESPQEKRLRVEKDRMYRVNQISSEYFESRLAKNAAALSYLREDRGLSDETIAAFGLGFAPESWDGLANELKRRKVPEDLCIKLGLLGRRSQGNGVYDRFRGKIVFPINAVSGDVAGFGARRADWLQSKEDGPKYLNSIDSPVYDKSRLFYGLDKAKTFIRKERQAILVEGYFDVIALNQAGVRNAIAGCGTAISKHQAQQLAKLASEVVTAYDGDEAGQRATRRAAELLLQAGVKVRVLRLPKSDDPDTFISREGNEAFRAELRSSPSAIDLFLADARKKHAGGGVAGLVEVVNDIRPLLTSISDAGDREVYVQGVAQTLGIDARQLMRRLNTKNKNSRTEQRPEPHPFAPPNAAMPRNPPPGARRPIPVTEKTILRHLVSNPSTILPQLVEAKVESAFQHPGISAAFRRAQDLGVHFNAHHALEAAADVCSPEEISELRQGLMSQLPNEDELAPCIDHVLTKYYRERLAALTKRIAQESNPEIVQSLMTEAEQLRSARETFGSTSSYAK
ncbi:MAG: DNA primase [Myxococcota bacterium]|nr:DNA primase [Myxococcota bacterium]